MKEITEKNLNLRTYWEILECNPFFWARETIKMHWINKFRSLPEIQNQTKQNCWNSKETISQHDAVTENSVKQILTRTSLIQKLWKFDHDDDIIYSLMWEKRVKIDDTSSGQIMLNLLKYIM